MRTPSLCSRGGGGQHPVSALGARRLLPTLPELSASLGRCQLLTHLPSVCLTDPGSEVFQGLLLR